jgi:hypothetical protein
MITSTGGSGLKEYHELTPRQREQVAVQFSATVGRQDRYLYELTKAGDVLCRRRK